jgi:predicted small secreted protein
MKTKTYFIAFILLLGSLSFMSGCQNTVHGMGQDMDRITGS